jgi:hypothetical protein
LLGLLQSPFITMIIIPALKLENTDKIKWIIKQHCFKTFHLIFAT